MLACGVDTLLPFLGFAIAASVTPGPNNVMVAASAANHGLRATLPHMLGIAAGFGVMVLLVGLGLAGPMLEWPRLHEGLRIVGAVWLLFLAWQIARAGAPGEGARRPPLGFRGGALFQWVNPKAWLLALGTATAWTLPGQPLLPQLVLLAAVFGLVCLPCSLVWAGLGAGAGRLLASPARLRAFNLAMAVLLALSVLPVLIER